MVNKALAEYRQSGYFASNAGKRFNVTLPAETQVAGTTGFTATIPQILLQAGASDRLILRSLTITIETIAGADPIRIHGVIDPDARYSSGGTSRTPSNVNTASGTSSTAAQVRDGAITATTVSGNERDVFEQVISNSIGSAATFVFDDSVIIGPGDTLLVYVQGGMTAPSFVYMYEFEDAVV